MDHAAHEIDRPHSMRPTIIYDPPTPSAARTLERLASWDELTLVPPELPRSACNCGTEVATLERLARLAAGVVLVVFVVPPVLPRSCCNWGRALAALARAEVEAVAIWVTFSMGRSLPLSSSRRTCFLPPLTLEPPPCTGLTP